MGGAITNSNWEEKESCMVVWHALNENEYVHPNIAVSETCFPRRPGSYSIELSARALTRDVKRGDSKVPLGIALSLVT